MSEYVNIPFDVFDYKNQNVLSSFALPETPLRFVVGDYDLSNTKILWEFGDGTISQSLTGVKYYEYPGVYNVNLTVFECFTNAKISTIEKTVIIYDYIDHTFTVNYDAGDIEWKNGKINGPIVILSYFPRHMEECSIFYNVNDSNSVFYYDVDHLKYSHLVKTYSFFEKLTSFKTSTPYYSEILSFDPIITKLFAKIENNNISYCKETDSGAFYVGLSGRNDVYFKDDSVSNKIIIDFYFDKNKPPEYVLGAANNLNVSLSATISENDDVSRLSITSNGLDGEFYPISSFELNPIKFSNVYIPFVVKMKDLDNFSVKNFNLSSIDQFNINVLSSGVPIPSSEYSIDQVSLSGGGLIGRIFFNVEDTTDNITLSASGVFTNDQNTSFSLTGISSEFSVYPDNPFGLVKINEDFDFTETFKNLRFQEFLIDKDILFNDFIGSIFGNINSDHTTLGKKIHEKISNFVDNHANIDRNEIFSLFSHMDMLDVKKNEFDSDRFKFPEALKRLIDLSSISQNRLTGSKNKFTENFDIKSDSSKNIFGTNLGGEINFDTYTASSNKPIVALEHFSGDYILINTNQPSLSITTLSENGDIITTENDFNILFESNDTFYYKLSDYSDDWGWPLVLPSNFQYSDMSKYYTFFEFVSGFDNTATNNTLILSENSVDLGFNFNYILLESLSLIKA